MTIAGKRRTRAGCSERFEITAIECCRDSEIL
jgi:hypothetical protein